MRKKYSIVKMTIDIVFYHRKKLLPFFRKIKGIQNYKQCIDDNQKDNRKIENLTGNIMVCDADWTILKHRLFKADTVITPTLFNYITKMTVKKGTAQTLR
jgi:hypothetical protein